jgi:predicted membrane chloride channel (bestrophin family)
MRFRLGLLLGFAVGYVLGSKAGTERYDQIRKLWGSVAASEPAQQLGTELRTVADRASDVLEQKASEQVDKVTELVQGGDGGGNGRTTPGL